MNRDPKDPGTLAYVIVPRRPDGGLPLLSKAPMFNTPEYDMGLHLDREDADRVKRTIDRALGEVHEVRPVIVYYAEAEDSMTLRERHRAVKKEVATIVYQRNSLDTELRQVQEAIARTRELMPEAAQREDRETHNRLVDDLGKLEEREGVLLTEIREVEELAEKAKRSLLSVQVTIDRTEGQGDAANVTAVATARAAAERIDRHMLAAMGEDVTNAIEAERDTDDG